MTELDLEQKTEKAVNQIDPRKGQELDQSISFLLDQVTRDDLKRVQTEVAKLAEEIQKSKEAGSKIGDYADKEFIQKFYYILDTIGLSSPYKRLISQKRDVEKVRLEYDSIISNMKSVKESILTKLLESKKQRDLEFRLRDALDERIVLLDAELKQLEHNYNTTLSEMNIDELQLLREEARTKKNQYESYLEERDETNLSIIKYKKEIETYQNALTDIDTRIKLAKLFKYNEVQLTLITQNPKIETAKFTQQIAAVKIKSAGIVDKFRKSVSDYENLTKAVDGPLLTALTREARKISLKPEISHPNNHAATEVSRFEDNIDSLVEQYKEQIKCEAAYK